MVEEGPLQLDDALADPDVPEATEPPSAEEHPAPRAVFSFGAALEPLPGNTEIHRLLRDNPKVGLEVVRYLAALKPVDWVRNYAARLGVVLSATQLQYFRTKYLPPECFVPRVHLDKLLERVEVRVDALQSQEELCYAQLLRVAEMRREEVALGVALPTLQKEIELASTLLQTLLEMRQQMGLEPMAAQPVSVSGTINQQVSGTVEQVHSGAVAQVLTTDVPDAIEDFRQAISLGVRAIAVRRQEEERHARDVGQSCVPTSPTEAKEG